MDWIQDIAWFILRRFYNLFVWILEKFEPSPSQEQIDRKKRSIDRLVQEGVSYIDRLPIIESEQGSIRRDEATVLKRAISIIVVAQHSQNPDKDTLDSLIKKFSLSDDFSPSELEFLQNEEPREQEAINVSWRFECAMVLLWALGFVDSLQRPVMTYNSDNMSELLTERSYEELKSRARLRCQSDLLDEADLIYRYHWATRNAGIAGETEETGLDDGVVRERHYTLNWLTGYGGQAWDDIETDT